MSSRREIAKFGRSPLPTVTHSAGEGPVVRARDHSAFGICRVSGDEIYFAASSVWVKIVKTGCAISSDVQRWIGSWYDRCAGTNYSK